MSPCTLGSQPCKASGSLTYSILLSILFKTWISDPRRTLSSTCFQTFYTCPYFRIYESNWPHVSFPLRDVPDLIDRDNMEDAHCVHLSLSKHTDYSFFGVFDGHNGTVASTWIAEHLAHRLDELESFTPESIAVRWVFFHHPIGITKSIASSHIGLYLWSLSIWSRMLV